MAVFTIVAWELRTGSGLGSYTSTPYFSDVPSTYPFFPFIQKAMDLGVFKPVNTCGTGLFCPDNAITRGQSAVDIVRGIMGVFTWSAAPPTFSPSGGTYTSAQMVTISTALFGASIRYTVDGSTPSNTTGTVYSGPITISANTMLNAIAYASGYTNSAVASAAYTFQPPPSITSITPTSGAAGVQVTISGSNFGSTQGIGAAWLGSTLGAVGTGATRRLLPPWLPMPRRERRRCNRMAFCPMP